jgi:hypothetical protein
VEKPGVGRFFQELAALNRSFTVAGFWNKLICPKFQFLEARFARAVFLSLAAFS